MSNPFSTFAAFGSGSWSGSTTSPSCRCPSKSRGLGWGEFALASAAARRGRQKTSVCRQQGPWEGVVDFLLLALGQQDERPAGHGGAAG